MSDQVSLNNSSVLPNTDIQQRKEEHVTVHVSMRENSTHVIEELMGMKQIEEIPNKSVAEHHGGEKSHKLLNKILAGICMVAGVALAAAAIVATCGVGGVVGAAAAGVTAALGGAGYTGVFAGCLALLSSVFILSNYEDMPVYSNGIITQHENNQITQAQLEGNEEAIKNPHTSLFA